MSGAVRIQRSRRRGWRMPEGCVNCTRPGPLGNPFSGPTRDVSARMFRVWLTGGLRTPSMLDCKVVMPGPLVERRQHVLAALPDLRGRTLACWCPVDGRGCHADVLLELANGDA